MAIAKLFVPPKLSFIDDFEKWFHETDICQCLTDLDKKKTRTSNLLPLDGNIRKTSCDTKVKDLNSDDSVNILLSKLKSLFAKDIS